MHAPRRGRGLCMGASIVQSIVWRADRDALPSGQEIAIRIFRTAHELAMSTVSIYSFEDRMSAHRYKADEAYQVGRGLNPIQAYLNIPEIVQLAVDHGVDMIQCVYSSMRPLVVVPR